MGQLGGRGRVSILQEETLGSLHAGEAWDPIRHTPNGDCHHFRAAPQTDFWWLSSIHPGGHAGDGDHPSSTGLESLAVGGWVRDCVLCMCGPSR